MPITEPSPGTVASAANPFVGRESELQLLHAGLDSTLSGGGRLFLIAGEPGIGKTRLADQLGAAAAAKGARVIWGRCWEGGGAPAYWPWIQIFRALSTGSEPGSVAGSVMSAMPIRELEDPTIQAESAHGSSDLLIASREPNQDRFRLFDSLNARLLQASQATPLMLVLDDCHAADAASMLLLRFISRNLRSSRILVVATYRETDAQVSPFLPALLAEIAREGQTLTLRGISAEDVGSFVAGVTGKPPKPATMRALLRVTEGNPLFLGELVRLLIAEGRIEQLDTRGLTGFKIPDGVRALILRRMELLSDSARALMSTASTLGREFELALLSRVSGTAAAELEAALEEAIRFALIAEQRDSSGRFRFLHAMIPEALYAEMPRQQRQLLHQRVADAIEQLHVGDLESRLDELAYHYARALPAGSPEKAYDYAARAAARARKTFAYEEAARLFGLALAAVDAGATPDQERRCELMLARANALYLSGDFEQARQTFEQAAAVAIQVGDAERQAIAALGLGVAPSTPGVANPAVVATLERALAALGEQDSALRATVMARLAEELYWSDQVARRLQLASGAVEMARRTGDRRALVDALYGRHIVLTGPDTAEERLAIATEIISLIQELGVNDAALRARYLRIQDLLELGDIVAVDREIETYTQHALELRQQHLGFSDLLRAMRALMDGRFEEAEQFALRGFEAGQRRHEGFSTQVLVAQLSVVRREQGRLGELVPAIRGFTAQYPGLTFARAGLAFCLCQIDDRAAALGEFEYFASAGFDSTPRNVTWLASLVLLSEVCAYLNDKARAADLYRLLLPYATRNATIDVYVCYASVAHYLGMLAVTMGDLEAAERHFEAALEFNHKMAARPWIAYTRCQYASMLLARDAPGDHKRAIEHAGLALATADALSMKPLAERLRELTGPDLRANAGPDGTVTIMFSDMEDSTGMTEKLGDLRAQELLREHNAIVRELVAVHDGFEVKSMGDGFMIAFSSARRALLCAVGIQKAFAAYRTGHPATPIHVAVGLHTGEAIREAGDFYGKTVIMASRIVSAAASDDILVSATFRELTASFGDFRFDSGIDATLKGLAGTHRLFRVLWNEASPSRPA